MKAFFAYLGVTAILGCAGLAAIIVIEQTIFWLGFGGWPDVKVLDAFLYYQWPLPFFRWGGVQNVVMWLLDLPLAIGMFLFGVVLSGFFYFLAKDHRTHTKPPSD